VLSGVAHVRVRELSAGPAASVRTDDAKDSGVAVMAAENGPGPVAVIAATRICVATFVVSPDRSADVPVVPVETIAVVQLVPESVETWIL
jgi:hypothetical protein